MPGTETAETGKAGKASLIGKWRQRAKEKLREWYEEEDKGKDD